MSLAEGAGFGLEAVTHDLVKPFNLFPFYEVCKGEAASVYTPT
jgi:hypothetical protein